MEDNKNSSNEKWKNKARPAIYSMAGVYLMYLAYSMFQQIAVSTGGEQMLMIVFTILFAIIGLGMIIFGLRAGYKSHKQ